MIHCHPLNTYKKALFGIWIINKPSHKCEDLRKGMLGLL